MPNKKIISASIILGILVLGSVSGSLWLLTKNSYTENVTIITKSVQEENTSAMPEPAIVTVDTLSPEELTRLWLQMWYQRDFAGMYAILDQPLRDAESSASFMQRMQTLPVLTAIKINATEKTSENESTATLTLTVDAKTSAGAIQRDLVFGFQKTDGQWKIATPPDLSEVDKK
ncbi:MAG: NTF2-like N-terminal transpeptidase domain-containing protein [bacterium]|nr:NTF2-like N-terminal transpeptidase domain-containing protein [bacterium]